MKKYIGFALGLFLIVSPVYASTPNEQYVALLSQLIQLLEQQVQLLTSQLVALQTSTSTSTSTVVQPLVTGSVQTVPPVVPLTSNPQIIMNDPIECTLSADTNAGAPSSYVNITWTSNADSATMTNSHISDIYKLEPASGGTKKFQLSSELAENNIFTAHFVLKEQSKDCSVQVLTQ